MPIITIFGGTFGDDEHLARNVAQVLDCPFVGREILVAASQRCGVPEARLDQILEREPHWWARWQENLRPYRIALQAAMAEAALAAKVQAYFLGYPALRHANIDVQASCGAVKLSAIVPASVDPDEVKESVAEIAGVEHVSVNFVSMADGDLGYG